MPKVTIRLEDDLHGDVEEMVEESHIYESKSQLIRAGIRTILDRETGEFEGAR